MPTIVLAGRTIQIMRIVWTSRPSEASSINLAIGNRCYCSAQDPTSIVVASILCLSLIETLYQYVMVAIRAKFL